MTRLSVCLLYIHDCRTLRERLQLRDVWQRDHKSHNAPPRFHCDSLHCTSLFHCWHQTDRSHVLSAAPSIAHRPASPTARGNAAGLFLRALLMNMYNHYEWLTCCFAYVQPLSPEYRLQGPIRAQRCLSKLPSLWSSIYQSHGWSAPQVDRHNELWVLIIFLRGGKKC